MVSIINEVPWVSPTSQVHLLLLAPPLATLCPLDRVGAKQPEGLQYYYLYLWWLFVGLRPLIQILCHFLARGWARWLRYFTKAKAEVKYGASARIRGPKHDTIFEWPVSILIMPRHPFLPFKTHKTSAKNPRLLTITGAIWFCRYRQCTPSQLWMHAPGGEPTKVKCNYIRANVITFAQMWLHLHKCDYICKVTTH